MTASSKLFENVQADEKPPKRAVASAREWRRLKEAFADTRCVAIGHGCSGRIELHHIVPRSQGGDDLAENLAPLCYRHHSMLEEHRNGWEKVAFRVRLYVYDNPNRLLYAIRKIGEARFDRRYPGARQCETSPDCLLAHGHGGRHALSLSDERFWAGGPRF